MAQDRTPAVLLPGIAVAMGVMLVAAACGTAEPEPGASEAGGPAPVTQPDTSESTDESATEPAATWQEPTWQEPVVVDLGVRLGWLTLASGPAGLVAVSTNSVEDDAMTEVVISDDGEVWEAAATLEGVRLHDVTAGGPGYVAVGSEQTAAGLAPVVATSSDGRVWDVQQLPVEGTGDVRGLAMTSVGLVAVGAVGVVVTLGEPEPSDAAAWHSPDGESWTAVPTEQFEPDGNDLVAVLETDAGLLAIGYTLGGMDVPGALLTWRSSDGLDWVPASSPAPGEPVLLGGTAAGATGAVVVGSSFDPVAVAWWTADGQAWQGSDLPNEPADQPSHLVRDVASDGVGYVVVGDVFLGDQSHPEVGPASIWTSADGLSWTQVPQDDLAGPVLLERGARMDDVVHHDGRWLAFGSTTGADEDDHQSLLWVGVP